MEERTGENGFVELYVVLAPTSYERLVRTLAQATKTSCEDIEESLEQLVRRIVEELGVRPEVVQALLPRQVSKRSTRSSKRRSRQRSDCPQASSDSALKRTCRAQNTGSKTDDKR